MGLPHEVEQGLIIGICGLTGTLVPVGLAWTRDRGVASRRMRNLEEAMQRLEFWEKWLKLSTQVSDPASSTCQERVQQEIAYLGRIIEMDSRDAHEQVSRLRDATAVYQEKVHGLPLWREWLLFYLPPRPLAWIPRLFLYAGFLLALVMLLTLFSLDQSFTRNDLLIIEGLLGVWMVIFRYLSKWLERPHTTAQTVSTTRVGPPPVPVMGKP